MQQGGIRTMRQAILYGWLLTTLTLSAVAGAGPISVRVNGEPIRFRGAAPREVDGRVLVPLRGVLEHIGAVVSWDAETSTVLAGKDSQELEIPIGSHTAKLNGKKMPVDVPAMILNGTTMVPLRLVSESFGAHVRWD